MPDQKLTRPEIRKTLKKDRGALTRISVECNVTPKMVSLVLQGKSKSAKVFAACEAKAHEFLAAEAAMTSISN